MFTAGPRTHSVPEPNRRPDAQVPPGRSRLPGAGGPAVRAALLVLLGTLAILLARVVSVGGGRTVVDDAVWSWWVHHRTQLLTVAAGFSSDIGGTTALTVTVVLVVVWWGRSPGRRGDAALVAVVGAGAGLLIVAFKALAVRARPPEEWRLGSEITTSFPSGHALGSAAVFGVLGCVVAARAAPGLRLAAGVAVVVLITAVGVSRVYLGVHWATDVAGGWLIGSCWLLLCLTVRQAWQARHEPAPAGRHRRRVTPVRVVRSGPKTIDAMSAGMDPRSVDRPRPPNLDGAAAATAPSTGDVMHARDVMTHPVITVTDTAGVGEAAQILISHGFTALPVLDDDGRLIGIVTEADLLRDPGSGPRRGDRTTTLPAGDTVAAVMTSPVESLTPGADIDDAARMMVRERIRCLPIVDGVGLVGVITRRDLLRAAMSHQDAAARDAILHRLHQLDPRDRWDVAVTGGHAVIGDHVDDARDRAAVSVIANEMRGVARADVHYDTCDPF